MCRKFSNTLFLTIHPCQSTNSFFIHNLSRIRLYIVHSPPPSKAFSAFNSSVTLCLLHLFHKPPKHSCACSATTRYPARTKRIGYLCLRNYLPCIKQSPRRHSLRRRGRVIEKIFADHGTLLFVPFLPGQRGDNLVRQQMSPGTAGCGSRWARHSRVSKVLF